VELSKEKRAVLGQEHNVRFFFLFTDLIL